MILKVTKGSKLPVSGLIVLLSHNVQGLFVVCCCCFIFIYYFFVNIVLHVYRIKLILPLLQFSSLSTIFVIQSTLVISKSKGPSKPVRDVRTSTYQICSIEEKT